MQVSMSCIVFPSQFPLPSFDARIQSFPSQTPFPHFQNLESDVPLPAAVASFHKNFPVEGSK